MHREPSHHCRVACFALTGDALRGVHMSASAREWAGVYNNKLLAAVREKWKENVILPIVVQLPSVGHDSLSLYLVSKAYKHTLFLHRLARGEDGRFAPEWTSEEDDCHDCARLSQSAVEVFAALHKTASAGGKVELGRLHHGRSEFESADQVCELNLNVPIPKKRITFSSAAGGSVNAPAPAVVDEGWAGVRSENC